MAKHSVDCKRLLPFTSASDTAYVFLPPPPPLIPRFTLVTPQRVFWCFCLVWSESSEDLPSGNGLVFLRCTLTPITCPETAAAAAAAAATADASLVRRRDVSFFLGVFRTTYIYTPVVHDCGMVTCSAIVRTTHAHPGGAWLWYDSLHCCC